MIREVLEPCSQLSNITEPLNKLLMISDQSSLKLVDKHISNQVTTFYLD